MSPPVGLSLKRLVHHKLNEPPPPPFPGYANHVKKGDENYSESRCLKITEKSLIQYCERSELRLHFEWTKIH